MSLSLQRDNTLDILHLEEIAGSLIGWRKLLDDRTLRESHIILIGRENLVRVLLSGLLDHLEERALLLFAINDECASKDFMPAMLTIDLCESKHLAIGELSSQLLLHPMQIVYLLG